jgi:hypothetical protein
VWEIPSIKFPMSGPLFPSSHKSLDHSNFNVAAIKYGHPTAQRHTI